MMCNEQAYSLAVEKLLNIQAPPRAQWIRGKPWPLLRPPAAQHGLLPVPAVPSPCSSRLTVHSAVWGDHTAFEPHHGCDHTCPGHRGHDPFLLDV